MERFTQNPSTTLPPFIKERARFFPKVSGNRKASGSAGWRVSVFCLLFPVLCLALSISPATASPQPWHSLTPSQQETLAPLAQQWNGLPEAQQHNLLNVAKHYPELSAEEKQRFLSRLGAWSKLTPEQRQAARDKYRAFSQVPENKREQVRQMVKEEQAQ